jgi:hypothetical protein
MGAVLFAVVSVGIAAWEQDWTFDEPAHLEYARQIVARRPGPRSSVFNSKTPAMLPNALLETAARGAGVSDPASLKFVARLPSIAVFPALLVAVFFFTRGRSTTLAAWVAVLACALDPSLLAHSGLTCVDAIFALASFLALWAMIVFARRGDRSAAILLGLALGFSVTVKFTGLYLVPAFLALPFLGGDAGRPRGREVLRRFGWLTLAALLACLVVSAAYFFHDFAKPLSRFRFETAIFRSAAQAFGWLRLPLPGEFLTGIDMVAHLERGKFNVVILDRWYDDGVWYYFFVLGLLKTPLALLLGCGVALWLGLRSGAYRQPGLGLALFQSSLYLVYFSFVFRGQIGYRYVLMLLPVIYACAAIGARRTLERPGAGYAVLALAAFALLELWPFFGHPLAFTNAFVLPKRNAYRYLADSNLYWNEYHDRMPALVREAGLRAAINPVHVLPGPVVFDANTLSGVLWNFEQHRWVRRHLTTTGHLRHVLFVYDVSEDDFGRFLQANRTRTPPPTAPPCSGTATRSAGTSSATPLGRVLCVEARETSDVSLSALSGSARVGFVGADGRCGTEFVPSPHEVWYRLQTGRHVICLAEPDRFSGRWDVRRGSAAFFVPDATRESEPPRGTPGPR